MSLNEALCQELNVLRAIYSEDELNEERTENGIKLEFRVNPDLHSSEEPMTSRRCCSLQLCLLVSGRYPNCAPDVQIKNPRGLLEEQLDALNAEINSFVDTHLGQPLLYDVIQLVQEFLNRDEVTVPKLPCSICLSPFHGQHQNLFITQDCHHYFHKSCVARYFQHWRREKEAESAELQCSSATEAESLPCPVCRRSIAQPDYLLANFDQRIDDDDDEPTSSGSFDFRQFSDPIDRRFKEVCEKQRRQGGLIDLVAERNRMLLTDDTIFVRSENVRNELVDNLPSRMEQASEKPSHSINHQYHKRSNWPKYYSKSAGRRFYAKNAPVGESRKFGKMPKALTSESSAIEHLSSDQDFDQ